MVSCAVVRAPDWRRADVAPGCAACSVSSLCAEACWLAPSTMPSLHFAPRCAGLLAGAVLPGRRPPRGVRVAARGTGGSRGAAVVQPRGACAPRKLLDRLRASLRQKAPALCFAFARVLRQLSVYYSRRTLPRCFFIGVSQLRILVLSSSSCVGAVCILVSVVSVVSTSSE